jgi:adenylate cyclase
MSDTRRLAAILAADVVGYSRLMGEDEAGTALSVREHREAARPIVASHGGRIVKTTGDGLLLEFPSVVAAVECAVLIQKLMAERNAGVPEAKRIVYRIGVNLGDVLIDGDDILGDGVNIAARLEGICEPGGVLISGAAYDHVRGRIDADFVDLGENELKNIARPVRVYSAEVGAPAKPATAAKPSALKKRSRLALLAAGFVALAVIAAGSWHFLAATRTATLAGSASPPAAAHLSILVLPFANLSGDPAQDHFADALTDQLTTAVSRIRGSFVIAHSTARSYKGNPVDAKAIGKDLGVRYVLEGSVQPTRDQVRVTARLIDTETGAHLWADQFDAPRADLLQTQDEIVTRLARATSLQLPEVETARLKRTPAANPDPEALALQCQAAFLKNDIISVRTDSPCELALAADPDNVRALTWSAMKALPSLGRGSDPADDLKAADVLVSKALALDPNYAPAHLVNAFALQSRFRLDEAIAEDRRALELDPSLVDAYWHMGFVMRRLGEFQTSLELIDKAIRLSPNDPFRGSWYADKAGSDLALKQYDQAIEWGRRAIEIIPNRGTPHVYLIAALALAGQESQAHEALQRYLALPSAARTVAEWKRTRARYVNESTDPRYVEHWDLLIDGLRKAGVPEQ